MVKCIKANGFNIVEDNYTRNSSFLKGGISNLGNGQTVVLAGDDDIGIGAGSDSGDRVCRTLFVQPISKSFGGEANGEGAI